MALADRINQRMADVQISQADLARATGRKPSSVNNWLSGRTKTLKGDSLMALAKVLKCRPLWLSTGTGPMELDNDDVHTVRELPGSYAVRLLASLDERSGLDREILTLPATLSDESKGDVLQWLRGFAAGRKSGNGAP